MIPEGTFRARATEGALGFTSKGSEQIAVSFTLLEGDGEGSPDAARVRDEARRLCADTA